MTSGSSLARDADAACRLTGTFTLRSGQVASVLTAADLAAVRRP